MVIFVASNNFENVKTLKQIYADFRDAAEIYAKVSIVSFYCTCVPMDSQSLLYMCTLVPMDILLLYESYNVLKERKTEINRGSIHYSCLNPNL